MSIEDETLWGNVPPEERPDAVRGDEPVQEEPDPKKDTRTGPFNRNDYPTKTRVVLDIHKLVHFFGGPGPLAKKLAAEGHPISTKGINMWIWRNTMPAGWLPLLSLIAQKQRKTLKLHEFMREKKAVEDSKGKDDELDFLQ